MHHRVAPYLIALTFTALSCGRDSPVAPLTDATGDDGAVNAVTATLIHDMLSDPLFVTIVDDITDPALATVLQQSVDALASGDRATAGDLIATAHAMMQALADEPEASVETMILWSVVARYFEAAGLL